MSSPPSAPPGAATADALAQRIGAEIATQGPITVARFMEMALTEPGLGYYMIRDPFGAGGDFVTAPEISQMFGEMLGLWVVASWERMGRPTSFVLAELGPGRGTLMADALRAVGLVPECAAAAHVALVEASPALIARQRAQLGARSAQWYSAFGELPRGPLILIANEFFDVLPVRQFLRSDGTWRERRVERAAAGFRFVAGEPVRRDDLPATAADGTIVEVCEAGAELAAAIAARVGGEGGAALIIDYGHGTSGAGETLQAVRGHDYADPLADPGRADITAHVDFAALSRAARDAGAAVHGPLAQGWFLTTLGIAKRAERLAKDKDEATARAIAAALKRLIAPSEMGNLFKVLAITDPRRGPPLGFEPRSL